MKIAKTLTSVILLVALVNVTSAQEKSPPAPKKRTTQRSWDASWEPTFRNLPRNLARDQKAIWTSPVRLREQDTRWMALTGIALGTMFASDRFVPRQLALSKSTQSSFNKLSNVGIAGFGAIAGGMYVFGRMNSNERMSDAGFMAFEAALNSIAVAEVVKVATGRERPNEGDGRGGFRAGGSSFPSEHAMLAWSTASVLAHQYPGPLSKFVFYGGASAVSISRVLANRHFPSDALAGTVLGYLIGQKVYDLHHLRDEEAANYGSFQKTSESPREASPASAYVPLDSWAYAAVDKLAALGLAPSAFISIRPWTRQEFQRILDEIDDTSGASGQVKDLIEAVRKETSADDGTYASVDEISATLTGIQGPPLRDDYNFGETVINNFGRPYAEGMNAYTTVSGHAGSGAIAGYVRAEYQHSPSSPALPLAARTAQGLGPYFTLPPAPAAPFASVDRVRLLEAYVSVNLHDWQLSFGKQSLWWGPGDNGGMLMSNNAEPITMARLDRTEPLKLPLISKLLGPMRTDFFAGRLTGHSFVNDLEGANFSQTGAVLVGTYGKNLSDQPYLLGQKISFKPTPNLEFGVSRTSIVGGPDFPMTPRRIAKSLFSITTANTSGSDPGDRKTGFDFRYRIPGLRDWLVLYNDAMAEDEINPIGYPRRSAMNPGIYLPKIPKLNKLDLRAEAAYTDLPGLIPAGYFYWNVRYLNGYTNGGHLVGNWTGREGKSLRFVSHYTWSPERVIGFSYRQLQVNPESGRGGSQRDWQAEARWPLRPNLRLSAYCQYERWDFPVLSPTVKSDTTISVKLTYSPKWSWTR